MHTHTINHTMFSVRTPALELYKVTTIVYNHKVIHVRFTCLFPGTDVATDMDLEDIGLHLKILSLLENPGVIVAAAAAGDANTLKEFLRKHPTEVCSHLYSTCCYRGIQSLVHVVTEVYNHLYML